jgi:hypothetical protein
MKKQKLKSIAITHVKGGKPEGFNENYRWYDVNNRTYYIPIKDYYAKKS